MYIMIQGYYLILFLRFNDLTLYLWVYLTPVIIRGTKQIWCNIKYKWGWSRNDFDKYMIKFDEIVGCISLYRKWYKIDIYVEKNWFS